ncbi:hypothetical protein BS47DRAFT_189336 [Hydnum rufescens UP504]|uniref:Uncharacterized protein n=1 Tax=Hydnum rufescens UP504 TaxID=1448309 RepID=A0A9P6DPE5_9AGAM|nr:hypothetical protein BS47DRAFT_189336 [Hydnum rufescens UP504]
MEDTGNGGNGESPMGGASGGRAGDVHLPDSHSTTNNVLNVWHIYTHTVGTPVGEGPPPSGIYICCHFGGLELRIEFVPRLFPFIIRIRHHVYDRVIHSSSERL